MTGLLQKHQDLLKRIDFKLFNRNGLLIFRLKNPGSNWDGTYKGKIVSPGVYFYQCDVFERRISGLEQFHLSGFVHVITEKGCKSYKAELKTIMKNSDDEEANIIVYSVFAMLSDNVRTADRLIIL